MAKAVERRKGTATEHASFTGNDAEITVNTTNKSVHVHDGATAGGYELARTDLSNTSITATITELNYVDGVTSGIQTQLNSKASLSGANFTGSVDVTGTVTADGLTVDGASTMDAIELTSNSSFPTTGLTLNSNGFSYEMTGSQGKIFRDAGNNKALMYISSQNDLHLYEDTGTTAKFVWDASAESLGIGTASPWETLSIPFNKKLSIGNATYPFSISRSSGGSLVTTIEDGYDVSNTSIDFKMRAGSANEIIPLKIKSTGDLEVAGGIYLGGTGAANKLDDYEEGVWTPTLHRSTGGDVTATYTSQAGHYTKIGRMVFVECEIVVSSVSSQGSGYAMVNGLPFTASGSAYAKIGLVTTNSFVGRVINKAFASSNKVYFGEDESTGFPPEATDFNTGSTNLRFSLAYQTEA